MFVIETSRDNKKRTIWTAPVKCRFCAESKKAWMEETFGTGWEISIRPTTQAEVDSARYNDRETGRARSLMPKWDARLAVRNG